MSSNTAVIQRHRLFRLASCPKTNASAMPQARSSLKRDAQRPTQAQCPTQASIPNPSARRNCATAVSRMLSILTRFAQISGFTDFGPQIAVLYNSPVSSRAEPKHDAHPSAMPTQARCMPKRDACQSPMHVQARCMLKVDAQGAVNELCNVLRFGVRVEGLTAQRFKKNVTFFGGGWGSKSERYIENVTQRVRLSRAL